MQNFAKVPVLMCAFMGLTLATAQSGSTRTNVAFDCTCKDTLSMQLATKTRDLLAVSPRYKEVDIAGNTFSKKPDTYEWKISAITVASSGSETNPDSIAVSIVITFDTVYMGQFVEVCGASRLSECASSIISDLDAVIHNAPR